MIKQLHPFIKTHLIFLIAALPLLFFEKGTFVLWFNQNHTAFLDGFFKYITHLGSGLMALVFILVFLSFSYYNTIIYSIGLFLSVFIIEGVSKRLLFNHVLRPAYHYADQIAFNFIEGATTQGMQTFPSGHTGAAFTLMASLALILPRKFSITLFVIALLVGISRVYLLQHFFVDVYAGSIVGTAMLLLSYFFFNRSTNLSEKASWQRGLLFSEKQIQRD